MLPFCFEWVWDMGHIIFHGGLWYALTVIGIGVSYCVIKTACYDMKQHDGQDPR
jgi:hypothetical protein